MYNPDNTSELAFPPNGITPTCSCCAPVTGRASARPRRSTQPQRVSTIPRMFPKWLVRKRPVVPTKTIDAHPARVTSYISTDLASYWAPVQDSELHGSRARLGALFYQRVRDATKLFPFLRSVRGFRGIRPATRRAATRTRSRGGTHSDVGRPRRPARLKGSRQVRGHYKQYRAMARVQLFELLAFRRTDQCSGISGIRMGGRAIESITDVATYVAAPNSTPANRADARLKIARRVG